jgi:molybdenum cofactor synthesis domain-containing protein
MPTPAIITAALLIIGDEILSGRTKDKNIGYIAEYMTNIGIDLKEVRVVPDEEEDIVAALNALRSRYSYVFTTGGIGPTHDDITADCVAKAFGVPIDVDPRAVAAMRERVLADLKRVGVVTDHRLVAEHSVIMDPAYVHITQRSLSEHARITADLRKRGVHSIGRYGGWTYCSIEDNIVDARALVAALAT